jgi:hypothetical protein
MLAEYEIDLPVVEDNASWFRVLVEAFGFWDLPLANFYSPFLHQLPSWKEQDPLEPTLGRLLDDLDHATDPAKKAEVVQSMRAAIRRALAGASRRRIRLQDRSAARAIASTEALAVATSRG